MEFVKLETKKDFAVISDLKRKYIDKPIFTCTNNPLFTNEREYYYSPGLNFIINRYNDLAKKFDDTIPVFKSIDITKCDDAADGDHNFCVTIVNSKNETTVKTIPFRYDWFTRCDFYKIPNRISSSIIKFIFEKLGFLDDIDENETKRKFVKLFYGLPEEYTDRSIESIVTNIIGAKRYIFNNNSTQSLDSKTMYGYLFVNTLCVLEKKIIPSYDVILNEYEDISNFVFGKMEKFDRLEMQLNMYMNKYNRELERCIANINVDDENETHYYAEGLFNIPIIDIKIQPIRVSTFYTNNDKNYRASIVFEIESEKNSLEKIYIPTITDYEYPKLTDIAFDLTIQYLTKVLNINNIDIELERKFVNQVCSRIVYVDNKTQKQLVSKDNEEEKKEDENTNE